MARIIFIWLALTYSGSLLAQVISARNKCILQTAKGLIGIKESPKRNNTGPEVDRVILFAGGKPGQPWCAYTQMYLWKKCGVKEMGGGMASSWAVASKRVKQANVAVCDHFVVYNKYIKRIGHVGLVFAVYPEESFFKSFEGNINSKGDRESQASIAGCLMREYAACFAFYRW